MVYPYVGPVAKDSGTGNLPVKRIVVHCTVGADGTNAMSTVKYFKSSAAKGSAHAVADSDEVLECAHDNVVCWHAPPNTHSLGIELCCSLSSQGKGHWSLPSHVSMMKLAAKWVALQCYEHGIPPRKLTVAQVRAGEQGVCGHYDVSQAFGQSSHWDPGPYFPWVLFMNYVVAEYNQLTKPSIEEPTLSGFTAEQLSKMMYDQNAKYGANLWAASTGTGAALIATVNGIAKAVGILSVKLDTIQKQITEEDVQDDAALKAATNQIDKGLADLQTAVDLMMVEVESIPKV